MPRTRIKICGISQPEHARIAVAAGADAIGLVFYPASPRAVTVQQAQAIVSEVPPFVSVVGLFVDAPRVEVESILKQTRLDVLQFHGNETDEACRGYGRPYIKALRMQPDIDVIAMCNQYPEAGAILLDTYEPGVAGGTGRAFDWSSIPEGMPHPLILAGGLTPENVALAVRQVKPFAVDVSGGVELQKGIKDPVKICRFIEEVQRVDAA